MSNVMKKCRQAHEANLVFRQAQSLCSVAGYVTDTEAVIEPRMEGPGVHKMRHPELPNPA